MKLNLMNFLVFLGLITLTFSSCLKDGLQDPIIIVDPPMWSNSAAWEETEKKSGAANWEALPSGNLLILWWEYRDSAKTIVVGEYKYNPINSGIGIDSAGYIQMKDGLLSFLAVGAGGQQDTTAIVEYLNEGDTSLVIRNISAAPVTEIRYKKIR